MDPLSDQDVKVNPLGKQHKGFQADWTLVVVARMCLEVSDCGHVVALGCRPARMGEGMLVSLCPTMLLGDPALHFSLG